jgi:hypothetical protein
VAYASRTLSAQERKVSSIYELECLAVLLGRDKFRKYIEHQEFVLETDIQALAWLLSHPRQLEKIGRWVAKISALKFVVKHITGTQNIVADVLSRMLESPAVEEPSPMIYHLALTHVPLAFQDLKQLQLEDPELSDICSKLKRDDKVVNYVLSKGALYWQACNRRGRNLALSAAARAIVFPYLHEFALGGHLEGHGWRN